MTARLYAYCLCAALYAGFFAYVAQDAWRHPMLNWDMTAYMGVAESYTQPEPRAIYDHTMARLKALFTERSYKALKQNPLSADAETFYQQLPFYRVKPLYVGGMWLLNRFGVPLHVASYALSIAGFVAVGLICFLCVPRGASPPLWWLAVVIFCLIGRWAFYMVPPWSTPDTLCTALFLAGFCLWVYRKSAVGFAAFVLLAQLARPDMLMLTLFLTVLFAVDSSDRMPRRQALGIGAAALALYLLVNHVSGYYGWRTLFHYVFVQRESHPATAPSDVSMPQFFRALWDGVWHLATDPRVLGLLLASALLSFGHDRIGQGRRRFVRILWVAWLAFGARFVLFPAWWEDRYYYPNYFIMLYALAEIVAGMWERLPKAET